MKIDLCTVDPDDWKTSSGMGSCFHRALTRWARLHDIDPQWRIGIGVLRGLSGEGIVHAWLEAYPYVVSAATGEVYERHTFYENFRIDPRTVRLVNPRKIVRRGVIDRHAIDALLALWGGAYRITADGGVVSSSAP